MSRTVELKLFIVLYYALFFDKTKEKNCACVSFLYFGRPLENVFFSHEPQPQRPMTFGESTEATKDRGV